MKLPALSSGLSGYSVFSAGCCLCILLTISSSCRKEVNGPATDIDTQNAISLHSSVSRIILLQGNENCHTLLLKWEPPAGSDGSDITYTIESATDGAGEDEFADMLSTHQNSYDFTVKELNKLLSRFVSLGSTGRVELRIKALVGKGFPVYSNALALDVTTYQHMTNYELPQYMCVPGNFNNWDIALAPHIVSADNNGLYEGFINFTNPYSQFLLVKSSRWDPVATYTYIGAQKFGFNGNVFSVFGGSGIYKFNSDINTNTWSYKKINSFGIHGNVLPCGSNSSDVAMRYDSVAQVWTLTIDLQAGYFRFRANNDDALSYGYEEINGYSTPSLSGSDFVISKPGNYTMVLSFKYAGNYACSIIKNSIPG